MARRTITGDSSDKGTPLPDECLTFLKHLEHVDRPGNAPNVLDANQWQMLCKMRRVKLEMEFRVKSLAAQVVEAESAVNGFVREINAKKARVVVLEQEITDVVNYRVSIFAQWCWRSYGTMFSYQ